MTRPSARKRPKNVRPPVPSPAPPLPSGAPDEPRRLVRLLLLAGLFALGFLLYAPGLSGGWVLDDLPNIVRNSRLVIHRMSVQALVQAAFSFKAGPLRRPLSMLTFALDRYFFGPAPFSFKLTNVLLELLNALLVYLFGRALLDAYRRLEEPELPLRLAFAVAFAAAALWLVLPLNLTSVLYVVQREAAFAATFVLLGLIAYTRARLRIVNEGRGWTTLFLLVPFLEILAAFAKESGALLPLYALVVEFFLFRFRTGEDGASTAVAPRPVARGGRRLFAFYLLTLVLPGLAGLVWMLRAGYLNYVGVPFTLGERLLTEPRVVLRYILWVFVPRVEDYSVFHTIGVSRGLLEPPATLFAIVVLAALLAAAFALRRRAPLLGLGIAFFFAGQAMESTIFPLELVFEQRNYLADYGLVLAFTALLLLTRPRASLRLARGVLLAGFFLVSAATLLQWSLAWRSNLALGRAEAVFHPESPRATYFYAQVLSDRALLGHPGLYPRARKALLAADRTPGHDILPDTTLLLLRARFDGVLDTRRLLAIERFLRTHLLTVSDVTAIASIVHCVRVGVCPIPPKALDGLFEAARSGPRFHDLGLQRANLDVLVSNALAMRRAPWPLVRAWAARAAHAMPANPRYRLNLVAIDLAMGDPRRAERDLAIARRLDRLGNYTLVIRNFARDVRHALGTHAGGFLPRPSGQA
jgi:hypothetical protein